MPYRISLKPGAGKDIEQAYNWYEDQQIGLGDKFLETLKLYYKKLEQRPFSFGKIDKFIRQVRLKIFPYIIVFEIVKHEVIIYAIFHINQNPTKKYR